MTHEDAGHYGLKHPTGSAVDPAVAAALGRKAADGRATCADAHGVSQELGITPAEVGRALDILEYRIIRCQLGLFGYSPDKKVVQAAVEIPAGLREQLAQAAIEAKIDCCTCWKIAGELGLERMTVSAACERLGLKIGPCQLGAF